MFIAILFMPLTRWLKKKKAPKFLGVLIALLIMIISIKIGSELVQLAAKEIRSADVELLNKINDKANYLLSPISEILETIVPGTDNNLSSYLKLEDLTQPLSQYFGSAIHLLRNTTSTILMTLFFLMLLLAGSIDIQKTMGQTIFRKKRDSIKALSKIEASFIKFIKVKFLISLCTGVCFGLICYFFGVSFPFMWGLIAFVLNFVQVVGSIVSTVILALFAIAEMDPTGQLLFFVLCITGVQILFGSILEPIFMGQSFRINIIMILIMLMLWGYLWGVSGIILAVPLTVLVKTILEAFPETKRIAKLMS